MVNEQLTILATKISYYFRKDFTLHTVYVYVELYTKYGGEYEFFVHEIFPNINNIDTWNELNNIYYKMNRETLESVLINELNIQEYNNYYEWKKSIGFIQKITPSWLQRNKIYIYGIVALAAFCVLMYLFAVLTKGNYSI